MLTGKTIQKQISKIRISVNGFLKRKDIYSTYGLDIRVSKKRNNK